jgi:hypothetical protein
MCEPIEETEDLDKLGQGFTSIDLLEEIDIGRFRQVRTRFYISESFRIN